MSQDGDTPNYRQKAPDVARRFRKLYERPVMMEVCSLSKAFPGPQGDHEVLSDIEFKVRQGEVLCLLGPSGSGKTTLMRIVSGADYPSSGKLLIDGKTVFGSGEERGLITGGDSLMPWMSVRKNLMFALNPADPDSPAAEQEAMHLMGLTGLRKYANCLPHDLSVGMQSRVLIARALAVNPALLLMDDPFSHLEPQPRAQTQAYLLRLWRSLGIAIVMVTGEVDEAIYLADRVLVLGGSPAHVQETVEIPVPRPRTAKQFNDPLFVATRRHLNDVLHLHADHHEAVG